MTDFFSIHHIIFQFWGYQMSTVEFLGTITGLVAVLLATQSNIWSWPVGIVNFILAFLLFYQVSLYSDMFLQVYYFFTGIYGWIYWYGKRHGEQTPITYLTPRGRFIHAGLTIIGTLGVGYFMSHIHQYFPVAFPKPAAYPYPDSFVAVMSILANWMLAQRRVENWILWIIIDAICTVMYWIKGIQFFSIEYFVFLIMAIYGLINWIKIYNNTTAVSTTK